MIIAGYAVFEKKKLCFNIKKTRPWLSLVTTVAIWSKYYDAKNNKVFWKKMIMILSSW